MALAGALAAFVPVAHAEPSVGPPVSVHVDAYGGCPSVTVRWTHDPRAGEPVAYGVYLNDELIGGKWASGGDVESWTFNACGRRKGPGPTVVSVSAVDASGQEARSSPVRAYIPPRPIWHLTSQVSDTPRGPRVVLSWQPNEDDGSVAGYHVVRRSAVDQRSTSAVWDLASPTLTDQLPDDASTMVYEVWAVDDEGLFSERASIQVSLSPVQGPKSESVSFSMLLSKAQGGGFPNGISRNPAVSSDGRLSRYVAYESDASNLVSGDTNGHSDVFVVRRRTKVRGFSKKGSPWVAGRTSLASVTRGEKPANGDSYRPALDGDADQSSRCLAFLSTASNLVRGDTNGAADVFVRDLNRRRTVRVSVDSNGRQANGASDQVSIDGDCSRVAFSTDATNLGRAATASAKARGSTNGKRQIYVRYLKGRLRGRTLLVSASNRGRPGNGNSFDVAFARKGQRIAFASDASNLVRGDRNKASDVFVRTIDSLKNNRLQDHPRFRTDLISMTARGVSGNGASRSPALDSTGSHAAYETRASDLVPEHERGRSQILRATLTAGDPDQELVSKDGRTAGNGDSHRPVMSAIGFFVFFDSEATNFRPRGHPRDRNGQSDVFKWYALTGNVALESRNHENRLIRTGSQHPAIGLHGNYVPFESADPRIDKSVRATVDVEQIPPLIPPELGRPLPVLPSWWNVSLQQIYLRYVGPCASIQTLDTGKERCLLH